MSRSRKNEARSGAVPEMTVDDLPGSGPTDANSMLELDMERVNAWLALDEDLGVRRVSRRFNQLARGRGTEFLGQSLFLLLQEFGVTKVDLERVRSWAPLGRTCFVEIRPGRLGKCTDHFALEVRPAHNEPDHAIRYLAIAWTLPEFRPLPTGRYRGRRRNRRLRLRKSIHPCLRRGQSDWAGSSLRSPCAVPPTPFP